MLYNGHISHFNTKNGTKSAVIIEWNAGTCCHNFLQSKIKFHSFLESYYPDTVAGGQNYLLYYNNKNNIKAPKKE